MNNEKERIKYMKAVILAGGEGTRLRPLTEKIPKPLVPVAGKPIICHIIELLQKNGMKEVAITLKYLGERIKDFLGDSYRGVELSYFTEDIPLGTAGSVKNTGNYLDGDFLVISGDAFCDFDFLSAIEFHYRSQADVTIMTTASVNPLEYGIVMSDRDGKVYRFAEKPSWSQVFSDQVNTGIYIINQKVLDLIPEGRFYDFSSNLFPEMMANGMKIMAYDQQGYWCDIGDLEAFYHCNMLVSGIDVASEEDSVIGSECKIDPTAQVKNSIVFDSVTVGSSSMIKKAIVCENAKIGNHVSIHRGAVIGEGCVIEDHVIIGEGVRISADKTIKEGTSVMENVVFGDVNGDLFCDTGIQGDVNALTSGYCLRLGKAIADAVKGQRVGIMCDGGSESERIKEGLVCGIHAGGGSVCDCKQGFEQLASYAAVTLKMDLMLWIGSQENKQMKIQLFDVFGLYPVRSMERNLEKNMRTNTVEERIQKENDIEFDGIEFLYRRNLLSQVEDSFRGLTIGINQSTPARLLAEVLREAGATVKHEGEADIYIGLDESGGNVSIREEKQSYRYDADMWHVSAILAESEMSNGLKNIAIPITAPACLEEIAQKHGAQVMRYAYCPTDPSENSVRKQVNASAWLHDGCVAAIKICNRIQEGISVKTLSERIPEFYNCIENYMADNAYKTRIIRELASKEKTPEEKGEGTVIQYPGKGRVRVIPSKESGFKLYAEAGNTEIAEEILGISKNRIQQIIQDAESGKKE